MTASNGGGTAVQSFTATVVAATGPPAPTNLRLSAVAGRTDRLRLDYTTGGSPNRYRFQLEYLDLTTNRWFPSETENDSSPPETFRGVSRGYYYRARGQNCQTSQYTDCGTWSGYSNTLLFSDPQVALSGLAATLDVGSSDRFTVSLTDLTYDEDYTVVARASHASIGFNSSCGQSTSQNFQALTRTEAGPNTRSQSLSFSLHACGEPGGRVTVELRRDSKTGVLEDSASQSVTAQAILLPAAPAPTGLAIGSPTRTSIYVNWTAQDNATKYRVEYRRNGTSQWSVSTSSATSPGHQVEGLTCNTNYQFRVTAYGDGTSTNGDWGAASSPVTASTGDCEEPVFTAETYTFEVNDVAPTGTVAGTVTATDPTAGDVLAYSITSGNTSGALAISAATGQITVAGALNSGGITQYNLRVQVRDRDGQTDTATVRITLLHNPPPAPEVLRGDTETRSGFTVYWLKVEGATRYQVRYRKETETEWDDNAIELDEMDPTVQLYTLENLDCERAYRAEVRAYGDGITYSGIWGTGETIGPISTTDCQRPVFNPDQYTLRRTQRQGCRRHHRKRPRHRPQRQRDPHLRHRQRE